MPQSPALEIKALSKHFAGTAALRDASLTLEHSSVLALLGENGAGKSTLIKALSGAVVPDGGTIRINGEIVQLSSPGDATKLGIATVYQELSLLPDLSVAENLSLGGFPLRWGMISWRRARREAEELLGRLGVELSVDSPVRDLSTAEKYIVEIAKALKKKPTILTLDEPTAALDAEDSERIFRLMDGLRAGGTSIIFVSHRLSECIRVAQHFVVLRDGETVAMGSMDGITQDELVAQMLGGRAQSEMHRQTAQKSVTPDGGSVQSAPVAIEARDLESAAVRRVTFAGHAGEIIGVAGLRGSGQTALCRALSGADRKSGGELLLSGAPFNPRSPFHALRAGVVMLPVDRKSQGLFMNFSVAENISMSRHISRRSRWLDPKSERTVAVDFRARLSIKLPDGDVNGPVSRLSGGNQQKVVAARCLAANPNVLILDEPTRGVDVGAKAQIHRLIKAIAAEGRCVIVSSSEIDELLALCGSVLVLHRGEMVAQLKGDTMDEHTIMSYASGHVGEAQAPSGEKR
jgi:ABC-type sugar transport system ATPase subunit